MEIEYNKTKTLMVHSFKTSKHLNLYGDNESELILDDILDDRAHLKKYFEEELNTFDYITFDDGLYQQINLIKLFPKEKVIFFPSFGLLRPESILPTPINNVIAHNNKNASLSTFMSSTEVWDLVLAGYKLGMHGWYHLNLNLNHLDIDYKLKDQLKILKEDAKHCVNAYSQYILNQEELYFCTPYNCQNDLQKIYIEYLVYFLKKLNIKQKKLIVFSAERTSIENFIKDNICHYLKNLE